MSERPRPLAGVRVLDFSWVWSGPMVGAMLADFGAEVIKIEHGGRLDNARLRGRPTHAERPLEGPSIELNPYFHQTNHGKLSITLNLKDARAVELVHRLAGISQAVVENLSVGALERLGLGYRDLAAVNPALVYLAMSAAGQHGPLTGMRAYAPVMSSLTGLEALVGYPGEAPVGMMNVGYGDPNAGAHALFALLAALWHQRRTGVGQFIDFSQVDALLAVLVEPLLEQAWAGRAPAVRGNRDPRHVPHGVFPARGEDAWVAISVTDEGQWRALRELMARDGRSLPEAWDRIDARLADVDRVEQAVGGWSRDYSREDLAALLQRAGVGAAPVLSVPEQWDHPQFQGQGLRQPAEHPHFGASLHYAAPWRMSATPPHVHASAPLLGADNDYVLGELLGLEPAQLHQLVEDGVVA